MHICSEAAIPASQGTICRSTPMSEELSLVPRSPANSTPTFRDLAAILFRQRSLFLATFCIVWVGISLYGLLLPSYSAQMKILVRRGRIDPLASPAPTSVAFERRDISEEDLNSEAELLKDNDLLRSVVIGANLVSESARWWEPQSREQREERAIRRLADKLKVEPIRKTNLITVSYRSADPAQAGSVLRTLSNAYRERRQRLQRPSGEFGFFEQQSDQARVQMEQAEMALMDFTHRSSVVSASLERDGTLQKMIELQAASGQTDIQIHEATARVQALQAKLATLPARIITQVRTADNSQLLEKLKSRLLELQLKRTELITKFLPSYRLVKEVDEQISEAKKAIVAEELAPVRDETTDQDPSHEWTRAELLKAQIELGALKSRAEGTDTVLATYKNAVQRLGDRAIEQEGLTRNLKAAEDKYLLYENKREEARIGDAMDSGGILDVTIAEPPTVPALPAHSLAFFLMSGFVVAGAAGTGIAFVADYSDPAFRTPEEITAYLDVPVLASLPARCEVNS